MGDFKVFLSTNFAIGLTFPSDLFTQGPQLVLYDCVSVKIH